jgi:hypothetical protein
VENVEVTRPQMTVWCMHFARWVTKVIDTLSEYVIIIAFLLQPWLHECVSLYVRCMPCIVVLWILQVRAVQFSSIVLSSFMFDFCFPGLHFYSSILVYKLFKFLIVFFF